MKQDAQTRRTLRTTSIVRVMYPYVFSYAAYRSPLYSMVPFSAVNHFMAFLCCTEAPVVHVSLTEVADGTSEGTMCMVL